MTKTFAILGRDPTDADVAGFLAALKGSGAKYRPDQARGRGAVGGQFIDEVSPIVGSATQPAAGRGAIATEDPTKMANLTEEYRAKLLAQLAATFPGMGPEELEANVELQLVAALADPANAGRGWYEAAHQAAVGMAERYGLTQVQAVGMIAAMSPQQEWGSNLATADFTARMLTEDGIVPDLSKEITKDRGGEKVTMTAEGWARDELAARKITVGAIAGQRLSSFKDPEAQAAIIKAWGTSGAGDLGGRQVSYEDDQNGKTYGATWTCGNDGVAVAVRIHRGEAPDAVLGGHKVRSFYNNITGGGASSDTSVTIDTHAFSAALGQKVPASDKRMGKINGVPSSRRFSTKGTYAVFADAYRAVAARHHLAVEDVQALVWINWRKTHG